MVSYEKFAMLLKEHQLSTFGLSKKINIPNSCMSDWKSGRSTPKADKLYKIAKFFGVPMEYFIEESDDEQKPKVDFKAKREENGLTVENLCSITDISKKDYLEIERGKREPTAEEWALLKGILDL